MSIALPLGDPPILRCGVGLEPTTQAPKALENCSLGLCLNPIITVLCQLSYPHHIVERGWT